MTRISRLVWSGSMALMLTVSAATLATAQTAPSTDNATTCAAASNPVNVKIHNPKGRVVYNTGVSRNDLVRIRKNRSRGVSNSNSRPLGLTLSDFLFKIGTSVRLIPIGGNKMCAYARTYDVTIGYSLFKVYIDRRYGRGSCEYRAVLDHENTHVSLYRRNMALNIPSLQRAVYSAARLIKPVIVDSPAEGARYMQKKMAAKLKPLVARMSRGADIVNARIDTLTSYKKTQSRCRNW